MPREIAGDIVGAGRKITIAAARFNATVTENLIAGAIDCLARHGVADKDMVVVRCPGAWELPAVVRRILDGEKRPDAVIALGCVIRGETPHFDYVAGECAKGLAALGLQQDIPVVFGVLTTDSVDQALDRAGLKGGNKGADAAITALEMIGLLGRL